MDSSEQIEVMYEVESILKKRINSQNKPLYLIKWKGWKQKTWQPIQHLYNVPEMIYQFQQQEKRNRKTNKNNNKSLQNQTIPDTQSLASRKIDRKKLKKMSQTILDSPVSEHSQQEIHKSKELPIQNTQSDKILDHPRIKITQQYLKISHQGQHVTNGKGNIYTDQIQKIVKIDRRNQKWIVLVKFQEPFQDSWEERDIIRMLYPYKLLIFYEELYRQKEQK